MISIIVPIYNAEYTLPRCIESIQAQTYGDLELILINDGSKDNSLAVCKRYAEQDNRIAVIDQPNGGVAAARNAGLDVAKGEYLYFIDPDDYAEPIMLEQLLAHQVDLAICSYVLEEFGEQGKILSSITKNVDTTADSVENLIKGDTKLLFPLWNKLFRRNLVEANEIRFLPLSFWEDACFIWEYLKYVDTICCVDIPLYHYTLQKKKQSLSRPKYVPDRKQYYLSLFRSQADMCAYRGITDESLLKGNYVRLCYNITNDLVGNIHRDDAGLSVEERVDYIIKVCNEPEIEALLQGRRWDRYLQIREAKFCIAVLRRFPPIWCDRIFVVGNRVRNRLKR